jgi:hypothetical protein
MTFSELKDAVDAPTAHLSMRTPQEVAALYQGIHREVVE